MRFALIDRIVELHPGERITAVKSPTLTEEFLQDHFPLFPVMPGVLMLESMYQASAWLLRKTDDFSSSMVLLKEARTVKYAGLVRPGQVLSVTSELQKREGPQAFFKARGKVDGRQVVTARLVLEHFNLADSDPDCRPTDEHIKQRLREEWEVLCPRDALIGAGM
jgi:3-hydroxyacyl-[acyl-carrier-protein] dehydratase